MASITNNSGNVAVVLDTIKLGMTYEALITMLNGNFSVLQQVADELEGNVITMDDVNQAIDSKIASVYKPAGSKDFSELGTPTAADLGKVYSINNGFTVTADFVEYDATPDATQKSYGPGVNVVCVDVGTTGAPSYKWDVLGAFIDLAPYLTKSEASTTYLTQTAAASTYLSQTDAENTYAKKTDAYTLPVAGNALGGVKNGGNVVVDAEGKMNVGSKLTFTAEASGWTDVAGGYKTHTIPSTAIPVSVFKTGADSTDEEVMVGLKRTATSIVITASEPFAGYVQVI